MSQAVHERFLRRALELANDNAASGRGGPFGAVIARGEEIVAAGVNLVTASLDPTAHAEVNAIREACHKLGTFTLQDCTLYSSCEPCPMCLGAIYWARLGTLYFAGTRQDAARAGFDDSLLYEQIALPMFERRLRTVRLLDSDGAAPFEAWLRHPGRIPY
ncbi:MAG: nucleoside deaminase [Bryobacteraceae bacterium]